MSLIVMTSSAPSASVAAAKIKTQQALAVLFADIVGSTRLYDTLGDVQAKKMVDECIALMRKIIGQYGGRVIKTIGDEVMCTLPEADSACLAACDLQQKIAALPAVSSIKRTIRVGMHVGSVLQERGDVFGDTVNLAARMAGFAKAGQIITTRVTVQSLSPLLQKNTRRIAALAVKGKGDDVEVCEIIWQSGEELTMATPSIITPPAHARLELRYRGGVLNFEQANASLFLGRDPSCQVRVSDNMASRQHARIERRQNKFFLIDQSTNGTYVLPAGEPEFALRREEVMLRGNGQIGLGHSVGQAGVDAVEYSVTG